MAQVVDILGVEFYPITFSGACRTLDWMLSLSDGRTRIAVTGNPIMVISARKDPEFARILNGADLLVPDGVGIVWAAKRAGKKLPERVTGVDLVHYLLSKRPAVPVFLMGGKPGVSDRAKELLCLDMPSAIVAGTHHGYFSREEEPAVVEKIRKSGAQAILAGMGSPAQEKFLWRNRDSLGARLGVGVGGVLDILAGDKSLTPPAIRKAGFEWLHRLVREPGRLWADAALVEFALRVLFKGKAREGEREDDDQGFLDARRQ